MRSAIASLVLLAACSSSQPAPVPVRGDLDRLHGEWRGSYELPSTGRGGSIVFTLGPGDNVARGDVIMIPMGTTSRIRPAEGTTGPSSQTLTIQFVRASGDSVSGTLSPFVDPDCNCTANATFVGRFEGNTIRGTFVTTRAQGSARGTWAVSRQN